MMESKKAIYDSIPKQYYPETLFFRHTDIFEQVTDAMQRSGLKFPVIAKPDTGMRGAAVRKLYNNADLENYVNKASFDFLLQAVIPYPNEAGIFYVRFPGQDQGILTGIVAKEFLIVTGDGTSTINQLIQKNPRFAFQLKALQDEYGQKLNNVPGQGESINLVPFGNHSRGSKFIDASHRINPKLTKAINDLCLQIPEFYFGRIDIMFTTFEDMENGKNFSIVELNGSGSEPTHIYDPRHSIFFAWREIAKHTGLMFKIGYINHKKGMPYLTYKEGRRQFGLYKKHNNIINSF